MVKRHLFHKLFALSLAMMTFHLSAQEDEVIDTTAAVEVEKEKWDSTFYHKFFASVHFGGGISKAFLDEKPDSIYFLPVSKLRESFNFGTDISLHFNREFGIMFSLNVATYGDKLHSLSLGDPTKSNTGDILKRNWTYVQAGIGPKALFGTYTQFSFATKLVAGLQMGIKETLFDSSGVEINSWTGLESTQPKLDIGISLNMNLDFPITENVYFGIYSRGYFGLRKTSGSNVVYTSSFFAPLPKYTMYGTHLGVTLGYQL